MSRRENGENEALHCLHVVHQLAHEPIQRMAPFAATLAGLALVARVHRFGCAAQVRFGQIWQRRERRLHHLAHLFQVVLEALGGFYSLALLQLHHDSQRFPRLVRTEFVQQMVDVDEQKTQVFDLKEKLLFSGNLTHEICNTGNFPIKQQIAIYNYLLGSPRTIRIVHEQIDQIQKVDQQRMVQLL